MSEKKVVGDGDEGVRCDVDEVSSDVQGRGVEVKLVLKDVGVEI